METIGFTRQQLLLTLATTALFSVTLFGLGMVTANQIHQQQSQAATIALSSPPSLAPANGELAPAASALTTPAEPGETEAIAGATGAAPTANPLADLAELPESIKAPREPSLVPHIDATVMQALTAPDYAGTTLPAPPTLAPVLVAEPPLSLPRYGVQVGVFASKRKALDMAGRINPAIYKPRIFAKAADDEDAPAYSVIIGLFEHKDDAALVKASFFEHYAVYPYITETKTLKREMSMQATMAMLN